MKLLIDNALSPRVAERLRADGYEALHVRELGMASASDSDIFQWCIAHDHVVVSADTDFGMLVAQRRETKPSVLLLRRIAQCGPEIQVRVLLANLPGIIDALDAGSIVVIEETRIRVRSLPIVKASPVRPQKPK